MANVLNEQELAHLFAPVSKSPDRIAFDQEMMKLDIEQICHAVIQISSRLELLETIINQNNLNIKAN